MIHEAMLAVVHEFDWIFNRDYMIVSGFVSVIDDGSEGRGFSASSRSCHEHQALMKTRKSLDDWRQPKLLRSQDLRRDLTEHGGDAVFLIEKVCAVPGLAGDFIAEVDVAGLFKDFNFVLWCNFIQYCLERVTFQWRKINALKFTVDA